MWVCLPSAGEVEQFAYCAHNWWLARQGVDGGGEGSRRGVREHHRKAEEQDHAEADRVEMARALRWMFYILGAAGSATFLTLELILLRGSPYHWIFLLVALVMVSASAALLTIAGIQEKRYRQDVLRGGLVPGRVSQQGLHGESVLEDPEWGIAGAPDYVMETESGAVPVEVKTGRTPDRPFPSHRLQLACYLRLLEVARGQRPEYGLLTYPEGVFRVEWDTRLENRLRDVLARMAEASSNGGVDRDHQHVGRCRGCARRSACDQRLA